MRYISQHNSYSCGPTAIFNILRYFNPEINSKVYRRVCSACHLSKEVGTLNWNFEETLKKFIPPTISCLSIVTPNYNQVRKWLREGNAVIINNHHGGGEHYFVVIGCDRNCYYVANLTGDINVPPITTISRKELHQTLKFYYSSKYSDPSDRIYPKVWVFSSKND